MKLDKKQLGEQIYKALNGSYPKRDYNSLKKEFCRIHSYTPTGIHREWICFGDYHPEWEEGLEAMVLIPLEQGYAKFQGPGVIQYFPECIKALNYAVSKEFSNPKTQSRKSKPPYTHIQVAPKNSVYYKNYLLSSAIILSGERIKLFPKYRKEVLEGLENASWDLDPPIVRWHERPLKTEPAERITCPSEAFSKKYCLNRSGRNFLVRGKLIHRSHNEDFALSNLSTYIEKVGGDFSNDKELTKLYYRIAKGLCENMMSESSWMPILKYLEAQNQGLANELSTEINNPDNHADHATQLNIPLNRGDLSRRIEESLK